MPQLRRRILSAIQILVKLIFLKMRGKKCRVLLQNIRLSQYLRNQMSILEAQLKLICMLTDMGEFLSLSCK
ncbi:hypothetical protein DU484_01430 [Haloplanus rubicundus]|uniref:Uncharacterized protein n=1 Tax=Haloplanus rubicundus TaxID=1547898 RepID=A0A345E8V0_9EURY|nr:hypothetical protein DU484_01430 [Haloplanus rubicundus]